MRGRVWKGALAASAAAALVVGVPMIAAAKHSGIKHDKHGGGGTPTAIKHVLLMSVDGLHQSDLEWYIANNPTSELAKLAGGGAEYSSAQTPVPSDSDPGMTAQMTGGNPRSTGV